MNELDQLLLKYLVPGQTLGILGAGRRGTMLKNCAIQNGMRVLLCDPPRADAESEEVFDAFLPEWGNGMGGCDFSRNIPSDTFLPQSEVLRNADLVAVTVPATCHKLINSSFLDMLRPGVRVLNFTGGGTAALSDLRIIDLSSFPIDASEMGTCIV